MKFTHLHVHTEWSLLDGMLRVEEACKAARDMGMNALAITDHGSMYGIIEFYKQALAAGLRPILGCEVYVARGSRLDKSRGIHDDPYHLVLLAENDQGYRNLIRIVSQGFLDGFYYKPRVDMEVLSRWSKGIIALTGCVQGEVPSLLMQGKASEARRALYRYIDVFGKDSVYLEVQRNGVRGQEDLIRATVDLSRDTGVPLVATNDCHYLTRDDAKYHDVLLAIQTGTTVAEPRRLSFPTDQFYLKSPEEMTRLFQDLPESIENTAVIGERCDVKIDLDSIHLPSFPLPPGETAAFHLREKAMQGLIKRYREGAVLSKTPSKTDDSGRKVYAVQDKSLFDQEEKPQGDDDSLKPLLERLEYELSMIEKMGYSSYFLIVEDFVSYAKSHGIKVGPGRGSAAGSLVAYALGITDVDPIENDLVFERFLNPERVTMPDIDIDFQDDRRDEVIEYVRRKYGDDRVAQIITFGTMAARAVIRDAGRAMGLPYKDVDKVAKLIPAQPGMTLEKALELSPELKHLIENPDIKHLFDAALRLEGMPRHPSTHAAGVVITPGPLMDYVPLAKTQDGAIVTQFPMENLEELGLLKMDFLGLRTLTVIKKAEDLIGERSGEPFRIQDVPLNDPETYAMLSNGESIGVFQLESSWVRDFLKELRPGEFKDLIATVALCRPGPMEQIPAFIKARFGKPHYLHPILEPVLKETYGVLVYQEQILKIASTVAGFTLGEADILRRAVGKKKKELLVEMEEKFLTGARDRGIPLSVARQIYELILKFANYGFNKNHAAPYALLAYQTAYLKCHYPLEFMAALLSSVSGSQDKVGIYLEEARRMGIRVLGPCVQRSQVGFSVEEKGIRYGLSGIKNIGDNLARVIVNERKERGLFRSLEDLVSRLGGKHLTRKALESLIKCGACDELGSRRENLEKLDKVFGSLTTQVRAQESLFGETNLGIDFEDGITGYEKSLEKRTSGDLTQKAEADVAPEVKLSWEKELLGMYFSGHPLEKYKGLLKDVKTVRDLQGVETGREVMVMGIVSSVKKVITKAREEMAFVGIEDEFGDAETIVFPKVWQKKKDLLLQGKVVIIRGNVEEQDEARRILASDVLDADSLLR